jgi:hypothetical protein
MVRPSVPLGLQLPEPDPGVRRLATGIGLRRSSRERSIPFAMSEPLSATDPVNPETFCDMARRENRAAIRKRKNFA